MPMLAVHKLAAGYEKAHGYCPAGHRRSTPMSGTDSGSCFLLGLVDENGSDMAWAESIYNGVNKIEARGDGMAVKW